MSLVDSVVLGFETDREVFLTTCQTSDVVSSQYLSEWHEGRCRISLEIAEYLAHDVSDTGA